MVPLNRKDVINQSRYLLAYYLHSRMVEDGIPNPPSVDDLLDSQYPCVFPDYRVVHPFVERAKVVQTGLDEDRQVQKLLEGIPHGAERGVICSILRSVFSDDKINLGRVTVIFCLAYTMSARAQYNKAKIRDIMDAVMDSMKDDVTQWIIDNGGWDSAAAMLTPTKLHKALQDYLSDSRKQTMFVLGAGVVLFGVLYFWNRLQK
ncbi:uncharacterized protein LOC125374907 isoform X1 [Haliotis rufescens]|uniref:uncharacterized protein LOC125374907 isoform X1 n=1 Tax=Haliotis rufescens TaxID=6454 RepID=UPI00201EDB91|nr:uncharacterized protein LOC125374907 isoform X1 [Haliotis rufescens]